MSEIRREHFLNPTTRTHRPSRVIFFDTETNQEKRRNGETVHTLRLGCGVFCRTRRDEVLHPQSQIDFRTTEDWWGWVEQMAEQRQKTYLVSHNLGFDLPITHAFTELPARGWRLESWWVKGMTGIFRWRKDRAKIVGLDDTNFFQGKLEKWAALVGQEKVQVDFENTTEEELWKRCRSDVDIMIRLWRLWFSFLDEADCGDFKPTVSSTAFGTWRHRFMPRPLFIHADERALTLEREAYKGGWVECLWTGERDDGPFYYLDVNSMYGYVMARGLYPLDLIASKSHIPMEQLDRELHRHAMIARVRLDVDEPFFPHDLGGVNCYPVGEFETTLTTPEIIEAHRRGWIRSVGEAAIYVLQPLFADYAQEFYRLRLAYLQDGNQGFAALCKLFINGLYGKFGQRGIKQEDIGECDPNRCGVEELYEQDTGRYCQLVYLGGRVYKVWAEGEAYNSAPGIAAHVTAYARLTLTHLMRKVPAGHLFYMDTDSLIVDEIGLTSLQPFMNETALGALKVQQTSARLAIYAPKDYVMDGEVRRKGVRSDALEIAPSTFVQDQWMGLSGLMRAGRVDEVVVKPITKHLSRVVKSGEVGPAGWVRPWRVERER